MTDDKTRPNDKQNAEQGRPIQLFSFLDSNFSKRKAFEDLAIHVKIF